CALPISIAAAKMGASSVVALDVDPVAVRAARSNCLLNQVEDKVRVNYGTLSQDAQRKYRESFDIALANITARSIIAVSDRMIKVLKPQGIFVASGISSQGLDGVLIGLALAGFKLEAIDQEGEWYAVTAMKSGTSPLHGKDG
ncbi:MAG: 50S ribosomal protein L11 methyltransferase, partial [Dehalococcoidales bacterium]|nr:50S ribosomal protein L11 methyltransferase [Dehalococcoidales bacterium]